MISLILLLALLSFLQSGRWRDSIVLWNHALDANPRSGLAHGNLGAALLNDGDPRSALPHLLKAAEIDPGDGFAQMNLVRAELAIGDTTGAARSALDLVAAYRRRSDFNADLTAAVLEKFAIAIEQRGDAASAARLRQEASGLRNR